MSHAKSLGFNIFQIQLIDLKSIYRTTGYLIRGEVNILIETGAAPSNGNINSAFIELGIKPEQIDFIFITHVHLDHAGGAGLLMSQCPNAKLLLHKRAKVHMADPAKLITGARTVYGGKFDSLFAPVLPVPEERIQVMEDGEKLDLGNGRVIEFYDTPGHAFHHLVLHDPVSRGIFSGDSAGIFFQQLFIDHGISFCLPVTAPTQFVPEIMNQTLSRLIDLNPERLYFTHFGMAESAIDLLQQSRERTLFFGEECIEQFQKERSPEKLFSFIQNKLNDDLKKQGISGDYPEKTALDQDIKLNIQGIIAYVERMERT